MRGETAAAQLRGNKAKSELKPNTTGYLKVLNEFKANATNCFVVGDSISKDVNPAVLIGAIGIWEK